jgi:hypothetical protein
MFIFHLKLILPFVSNYIFLDIRNKIFSEIINKNIKIDNLYQNL